MTFYSVQLFYLSFVNNKLHVHPKRKSKEFKSGDRAGHSTGLLRLTQRPGKMLLLPKKELETAAETCFNE